MIIFTLRTKLNIFHSWYRGIK